MLLFIAKNIERYRDYQTYQLFMRLFFQKQVLTSICRAGCIFFTGCIFLAACGTAGSTREESSGIAESESELRGAAEGAAAVGANGATSDRPTFAATAIRIPGSDISFMMISIPGGEMELGGGSFESESLPAVSVVVSPFLIAETETTYDAFAIFRYRDRDTDSTSVDGVMLPVDAVARPSTPYEDPSHGMDGAGFPAVGITQWSALQYARWLSKKTGRFFRLPTEAEWEYACLAGKSAAANDLSSRAWYGANSEDRLHMVGNLRADNAGLSDMLGNVAEWTLDQYDENYYSDLAASVTDVVDPWREPSKLHPRTVRGGSYASDASDLTCKKREESSMRWKRRDPQIPKSFWWNTDSPFVGFRLVAPINPPSEEEQAAFWGLVLGE
jgi:formylglycine-generating enzyme required for sulfatase activity